jgi:hypothetical protein
MFFIQRVYYLLPSTLAASSIILQWRRTRICVPFNIDILEGPVIQIVIIKRSTSLLFKNEISNIIVFIKIQRENLKLILKFEYSFSVMNFVILNFKLCLFTFLNLFFSIFCNITAIYHIFQGNTIAKHGTGSQPCCFTTLSIDVRMANAWRIIEMPIAVAARSKARTVFARSNTEIVGSNPTYSWMFVFVFCVLFIESELKLLVKSLI